MQQSASLLTSDYEHHGKLQLTLGLTVKSYCCTHGNTPKHTDTHTPRHTNTPHPRGRLEGGGGQSGTSWGEVAGIALVNTLVSSLSLAITLTSSFAPEQ